VPCANTHMYSIPDIDLGLRQFHDGEMQYVSDERTEQEEDAVYTKTHNTKYGEWHQVALLNHALINIVVKRGIGRSVHTSFWNYQEFYVIRRLYNGT
jgi:hypothetical protein